jgi:nuclear transport factor 2 (NTF2) superfamily protein
MDRPPLPPFTLESATQKVRLAEDAWNTRDPQRVALAYTADSRWRNRRTGSSMSTVSYECAWRASMMRRYSRASVAIGGRWGAAPMTTRR